MSRRALVMRRYTLRAADGGDVGTGVHESDNWLRMGDEFEHDGELLRVVERHLAPEREGYVAASEEA